MADTNGLIKIGLVAVGGYYLLRYFGYDLLGTDSVDTTPDTSGGSTTTNTQQTDATSSPNSLQATKNAMYALAQGNSYYQTQGTLMDWWQWNYLYKQIRGVDANKPQGQNDTLRLSLNEWFTVTFGSQAAGLTGGLGAINYRWNNGLRERYIPRRRELKGNASLSEYIRGGGTTTFERATKRYVG